ncbi:MAG: flagellar hook-basal body complex protein, partial [Desulfocapsa sp.]|nr:flagellar hook-basal body complex protein [Desulfocapsa sp.]
PATFNYSASTTTYDSLGTDHLVSLYFVKSDAADNTWDWHWSAEDADGNALGGAGGAAIVFDDSGILTAGGEGQIPAIDWANGSDAGVPIDVTFDTTQFNSVSTVISQDQNGFGSGNLTNVGINEEGIVVASYSNGEQVKVSQLVLGKFTNPGGLEMVGSNMFKGTDSSGPARSGIPGPELGSIFTNSLEQSNVDMGQEFVKMITTQRGFQANSKIITTVDELLGELINLKR